MSPARRPGRLRRGQAPRAVRLRDGGVGRRPFAAGVAQPGAWQNLLRGATRNGPVLRRATWGLAPGARLTDHGSARSHRGVPRRSFGPCGRLRCGASATSGLGDKSLRPSASPAEDGHSASRFARGRENGLSTRAGRVSPRVRPRRSPLTAGRWGCDPTTCAVRRPAVGKVVHEPTAAADFGGQTGARRP